MIPTPSIAKNLTYFISLYIKVNVRKWNNNVGSVRNYYKPKQKDAFFDIEGVITKDTLLFR